MEIRERIISVLKDAGLEDKIGKCYSCCTHRSGMSPFEVRVRPEYTPVDGDHVVTVTATSVQSYIVMIPYNYNSWYMRESHTYNSPEQMVKLVKSMVEKPKGCWA